MTRRGVGELEAEVRDVLWDDGGWMTPAEVLDALDAEPPLAYTTVLTILRRLHEKGQLERRPAGRAYAYHAVRDREESAAEAMNQMLAAAGNPDAALGHFVEGLDAENRRRLSRYLTEDDAG